MGKSKMPFLQDPSTSTQDVTRTQTLFLSLSHTRTHTNKNTHTLLISLSYSHTHTHSSIRSKMDKEESKEWTGVWLRRKCPNVDQNKRSKIDGKDKIKMTSKRHETTLLSQAKLSAVHCLNTSNSFFTFSDLKQRLMFILSRSDKTIT